jgi:hypothetical protein
MLAPLDIFKLQDGTYIWKGAADSFELAKSKVEQLAMQAPGEYMIFSHATRNKTFILDGPSKQPSH